MILERPFMGVIVLDIPLLALHIENFKGNMWQPDFMGLLDDFFFLRRIVVVNIEFLKSKWNASFVNFVEMYDEEKDMNLVREDDGER